MTEIQEGRVRIVSVTTGKILHYYGQQLEPFCSSLSNFRVSLIVQEKRSHWYSIHKPQLLKKKELKPKLNQTEVHLAHYQLWNLASGQTDLSHLTKKWNDTGCDTFADFHEWWRFLLAFSNFQKLYQCFFLCHRKLPIATQKMDWYNMGVD